MIIGIGTDLVQIDRISQIIDRFGGRFLDRVYTAAEQAEAASRKQQARFYAMRFAAKEAGWKALSPERDGSVGWHDFEVQSTPSGKPQLVFHGAARLVLEKKAARNSQIELSLSDDGGFALAFVVLCTP